MAQSRKTASLPTYSFLKRLHSPVSIEYSRLEEAYNNYDSSHAHRHDYFEILLFEKSGGMHEIDFVSYPVTKNTIHFTSPGQVHLLRRDKLVTGHVIAFREEAFLSAVFAGEELLMPSPAIAPVLNLSRKDSLTVNKSLAGLIAEYGSDHKYSAYSLSACMMLFLIDVIRLFEKDISASEMKSSNALYHNFRRLADRNITSVHTVSEYAKMLHVSPGHLNDTVKAESGKSAGDVIHDRLVLEAKRLLYHSSMTVKEISVKLNYDDPAYFTRFFRKHAGITPLGFRDQIRSRYSR